MSREEIVRRLIPAGRSFGSAVFCRPAGMPLVSRAAAPPTSRAYQSIFRSPGMTQIIQDIFNDHSPETRSETTADDVEGWDSIHHINDVVAVEAAFGLRFRTAELEGPSNVGDLATVIEDRAGSTRSAATP